MKLLHITSWHPSKSHSFEGIFIKRHINSLKPYTDSITLIIRHSKTKKTGFKLERISHDTYELTISQGWLPWKIYNWINATIQIFFINYCKAIYKINMVNYHIAYPNLIHSTFISCLIFCPITITEHSSEYRYRYKNFSLREQKIFTKIFKNKKLLTVSNSLGQDIANFLKKDIPFTRVFNVVDTKVFKTDTGIKKVSKRFLSIAGWGQIKRPKLLLNAFKNAIVMDSKISLLIGGDGPLLTEMKEYVSENNLQQNITFLGILSPSQINYYLNTTEALICTSVYETFSVICAEALCTGTPVITPPIESINEYTDGWNAIVFDSQDELSKTILNFDSTKFNTHKISEHFSKKFSLEEIGKNYYEAIKK
ncbi:glycosyltransferase family 4 protein [Gilvimarinus agarilyticus]|nr:glycosyltransferase family 4 protein [Gilvimarinus agarilyticus]